MAKQKNNPNLDEAKIRFIGDLNAILANPKDLLFTNGVLDTKRLSAFLNDFVQAYLQEDARKLGISQDKIPIVAVHHNLLTTPPGDPTGKKSFGNYNKNLNFIEVNANQFSPDMSNAELSQKLVTSLVGVAHEYRHYLQSMLAHDGVPTSQVVSKTNDDAPESQYVSEDDVPTSIVISNEEDIDKYQKAHFESRVSLDASQREGLTELLHGAENASEIQDDLLYGYGKMGLIAVAKYNQDQSSAFADGNRAASKISLNGDKRDPIIQAYYYNLAHEKDARLAAPDAIMRLAKDSGLFSKNFLKLAQEGVSQTAKAHLDNMSQPGGAVDVLVDTAVGKKKGDPGITPAMIERYYLASMEEVNVSSKAEQNEFVEGAILTILNNLEDEQIEQFITELNATQIDKSIIEKALKVHKSRSARTTQVTQEDILSVDPTYYDKPKVVIEENKQERQGPQMDGPSVEDELSLK